MAYAGKLPRLVQAIKDLAADHPHKQILQIQASQRIRRAWSAIIPQGDAEIYKTVTFLLQRMYQFRGDWKDSDEGGTTFWDKVASTVPWAQEVEHSDLKLLHHFVLRHIRYDGFEGIKVNGPVRMVMNTARRWSRWVGEAPVYRTKCQIKGHRWNPASLGTSLTSTDRGELGSHSDSDMIFHMSPVNKPVLSDDDTERERERSRITAWQAYAQANADSTKKE